MVSEIHSTEIAPELSSASFLQWVPDARGNLHLSREPQLLCPQCRTYCGHLYHDADTPAGACLSCKIDADVIDAREQEADEAAWADTCCTCGGD